MEAILKILNDKIAEYEDRIEYLRRENIRLEKETADLLKENARFLKEKSILEEKLKVASV